MNVRQQSVSTYPIMILMVDSADHISGKTGLTLTVTVSKNGGSFASISATVSEVGNGFYKLSGSGLATDLNTLGETVFHATGSGADVVDLVIDVVSHDPFAVPTAAQNATQVWANATGATIATRVDAAITTRLAATDYTAAPTANAVRDAVFAQTIETGLDTRDTLAIVLAACGGESSGHDTYTPIYKAAGGSATRIEATTDQYGNRSVVTLSPPA